MVVLRVKDLFGNFEKYLRLATKADCSRIYTEQAFYFPKHAKNFYAVFINASLRL
jgi:hypothetical protein